MLDDWLLDGGQYQWTREHGPASALVSYLRMQTVLGRIALIEAEAASYQRSGDPGDPMPAFENVPQATLYAVEEALVEMRKTLAFISRVGDLEARDGAFGLAGEESGVRDLTRALETLHDLANFLFRRDRLEALVTGKGSPAYESAVALAGQTVQELELALIVLAATVDEADFETSGIELLRVLAAEMAFSVARLDSPRSSIPLGLPAPTSAR